MRFIDELEGLVSNQISVVKTCLSITKLEARLAAICVYPLLINLCMLLVCLTSIWLTAMGMLGYVFMHVFNNALIAMACVFLVNILLLGILLGYLLSNLKKMSFAKTRAYLANNREPESHEFKETGDDCNGNPGKKIMEATDAGQ